MTYYLCKSKETEVSARVEYLKRVFHTLFVRCADEAGFICLKSFPFSDDGICFVTGHNTEAHALLTRGISAKTVVLNCCDYLQTADYGGEVALSSYGRTTFDGTLQPWEAVILKGEAIYEEK